jgi:hypothetical protein
MGTTLFRVACPDGWTEGARIFHRVEDAVDEKITNDRGHDSETCGPNHRVQVLDGTWADLEDA